MVNIYASTVSKDVFTWISLIILTIGILWAFVFNMLKTTKYANLLNAISATPIGYVLKFGGPVLVVINLVLLYIYQIFWTPHKHLKGVDSDKLNDFINEQKNK
jgi:hypothetical protein